MDLHSLFATVVLSGLFAGAQPTRDLSAVGACAEDYIQGWYTADGSRIMKAIHPMLSKCRVLPSGALQGMDASRLVQRTKEGIGKRDDHRVVDISILDIGDGYASAQVNSAEFFDFLDMVKAEDGWRILHVVWDYHEAEEQGSLEGLQQAASDYLQGAYGGDHTQLAALLHPAVVIRRVASSRQIDDVSTESLARPAGSGPGSTLPGDVRGASVQVLKMHKGCASLKITWPGGSERLQMCFRGGSWKILKIIRIHPPSA